MYRYVNLQTKIDVIEFVCVCVWLCVFERETDIQRDTQRVVYSISYKKKMVCFLIV